MNRGENRCDVEKNLFYLEKKDVQNDYFPDLTDFQHPPSHLLEAGEEESK